jgi:hypothetical protein
VARDVYELAYQHGPPSEDPTPVWDDLGRESNVLVHDRSTQDKRHNVKTRRCAVVGLRLAQEPPVTSRLIRPEGSEGAASLG